MSSEEFDFIYKRLNDDTEKIDNISKVPSEIQKFYHDKTIFLTGATGFMGKAIIEKLLRGCPNLKRIYVLVRNKRGLTAKELTTKLLDDVVFKELKKLNLNFKDKIVMIKGDLVEDELGISKQDRETLINEVNIVIHNGATTKFDEALSIALTINCLATKHMLDLAMECKNIVSFVYISTAFSHCYNKNLEEKFYPTPAELHVVKEMIEADKNSKHGLSEEATSMLLGKWPNVYTFTKSVAEDLVRQYGERANFACGVQRPSIVMGTDKEPFPGWVGNMSGPTSLFLSYMLGFMHCAPVKDIPMDFVPVDYSINALIATVWDLAENWKTEHKPVAYNCGSSTANPISLHGMRYCVRDELEKVGTNSMFWYPFVYFCYNNYVFLFLHIIYHLIPSIFADFVLRMKGQKPRAFSIAWKATKHWKKIDYFCNGNWRLHVNNTLKVYDKMNETDKKLFNFDIRKLNWEEYVRMGTRGYVQYILKEPMTPESIESGKRHVFKLKILHYSIVAILYLVLAYYLFNLLYSIIF